MHDACGHCDHELSGKTQLAYVCVCSSMADTEVQNSTVMACLAAEQNIVLLMLMHMGFYTGSLA